MKALFCATSSSGTAPARKLIQLLIKVGCFIGCVLQSNKIVQSYFEHGSSVVTSDVARQGILFPSVTVCVDAWTNKTRLCEVKGKCTRSSMVEAVFRYGACALHLSWKSYGPPFRVLGAKRSPRTATKRNWVLRHLIISNDEFAELRLESKLNASKTVVFMRTDLFPVIVKAPSTAPFSTLTPIAAQTGRDVTVSMKQVT
ncbi:hypothetical protein V5799_020461 [Amblyomma americanum]|uniref:Uncharacterized protein n=1 Tax=Amblyomma americanum TaxID=6943 RepID=A0AAQ4ETV5_AMBAM